MHGTLREFIKHWSFEECIHVPLQENPFGLGFQPFDVLINVEFTRNLHTS
jgi:hypothetical protein